MMCFGGRSKPRSHLHRGGSCSFNHVGNERAEAKSPRPNAENATLAEPVWVHPKDAWRRSVVMISL